jgi:glycosyltransferase involved in cell wall biosynthesis
MQILFLFPGALYPPTGDSIRSQDIAKKLVKLGNSVEFYCLDKGHNHPTRSSADLNIRVLSVPERVLAQRILDNFLFRKILKKMFSTLDISYDLLPLGLAALSPFMPLHLRSQLKKNDLIWVEGGFGNLFLLFYSRLIRKPFIFSCYGGIKKSLHQRLLHKVMMFTCLLSDFVITTSESEKKQMLSSFNLSPHKIIALPDSVDPKFLEPPKAVSRALYRLKDGKILILFMGNLASNHNFFAVKQIVNNYIPSLKKQLKKHNFHFLVVGPKSADFPFESDSYVTFTGYVANPQDYVHIADICLAPVYGIGGLHVKILAYMACGKAIITSVEGAKPLGLRDEVDALIADGDDDFVSKILTLINNEELRCRLSANSEHHIRNIERKINDNLCRLQVMLNAQVARV